MPQRDTAGHRQTSLSSERGGRPARARGHALVPPASGIGWLDRAQPRGEAARNRPLPAGMGRPPQARGPAQAAAPGAGVAHGRKLPPGFGGGVAAGVRARTGEETAIDLFGEGSELRAMVQSPLQTIGNAVGGLVSDNPSRAQMRASPVVQNAIANAWAAATGDYCERFGWIAYDKTTQVFSVPATSVGDQFKCTPPAKPANHVGEFHIHPPLDPGIPAMADTSKWPIGPSDTDERAAQADHSPGIVRDFDTEARTGGVTDYTYGPWKKI